MSRVSMTAPSSRGKNGGKVQMDFSFGDVICQVFFFGTPFLSCDSCAIEMIEMKALDPFSVFRL